MRELNYQNEIEKITEFIKQQLNNAGFAKVIVGLSGGIDSFAGAVHEIVNSQLPQFFGQQK